MGICSAADTAPCAYIGSVVDSAKVRADGRPHSPQINKIYDRIASRLGDLQTSLAAPVGAVLPPSVPHLLAELPASTQNILSQAVFHKRFKEASREDDFKRRFSDNERSTGAPLDEDDWEILATRRRILAIQLPGANLFLGARPTDEPFC